MVQLVQSSQEYGSCIFVLVKSKKNPNQPHCMKSCAKPLLMDIQIMIPFALLRMVMQKIYLMMESMILINLILTCQMSIIWMNKCILRQIRLSLCEDENVVSFTDVVKGQEKPDIAPTFSAAGK